MTEKQYKETIHAQGHTITLFSDGKEKDYLSLTDIAKYKSTEPNDVIKNWLRSRDTLDFLGLWEPSTIPPSTYRPLKPSETNPDATPSPFPLPSG